MASIETSASAQLADSDAPNSAKDLLQQVLTQADTTFNGDNRLCCRQ